jgi:hypothetical protein
MEYETLYSTCEGERPLKFFEVDGDGIYTHYSLEEFKEYYRNNIACLIDEKQIKELVISGPGFLQFNYIVHLVKCKEVEVNMPAAKAAKKDKIIKLELDNEEADVLLACLATGMWASEKEFRKAFWPKTKKNLIRAMEKIVVIKDKLEKAIKAAA